MEGLTIFTMFVLLHLGKMREVQRFLSRICAHKVKRVKSQKLITLIRLSVYKKYVFDFVL